jgi:hypothetical protein
MYTATVCIINLATTFQPKIITRAQLHRFFTDGEQEREGPESMNEITAVRRVSFLAGEISKILIWKSVGSAHLSQSRHGKIEEKKSPNAASL